MSWKKIVAHEDSEAKDSAGRPLSTSQHAEEHFRQISSGPLFYSFLDATPFSETPGTTPKPSPAGHSFPAEWGTAIHIDHSHPELIKLINIGALRSTHDLLTALSGIMFEHSRAHSKDSDSQTHNHRDDNKASHIAIELEKLDPHRAELLTRDREN